MNEEVKYLYTIHPRRPIKGLSEVPIVRVPKTLALTKDDVRKCLKLAAVWRRFDNGDNLVRVVPSSVDRLHNEKFMTEEEYKKFVSDQKGINHGTVKVDNNSPVDNKKDSSTVNDNISAVKDEPEVPVTRTDDVPAKDSKETATDVKSEVIPKDEKADTAAEKDSDAKDQKVSDPIRPINADRQNNQGNGKKYKKN